MSALRRFNACLRSTQALFALLALALYAAVVAAEPAGAPTAAFGVFVSLGALLIALTFLVVTVFPGIRHQGCGEGRASS